MNDLAAPIPAEGPLEPADLERLHQAILAAYPDADDLEILLSHKWGVRLSDQVYLEQPNRKIANDLVKWAESEGRTRELLGLLWSGRPGNPQLKPLAEQLLGDLAPVAARYGARAPAEAPAAPAVTRTNLEKTVTERSRLSDFGAFVGKLGAISASVCRVETPLSKGTGFLVGRRHVLTNFHVVEGRRRDGRRRAARSPAASTMTRKPARMAASRSPPRPNGSPPRAPSRKATSAAPVRPRPASSTSL